jgi:putative peptidoglycan lipid II flippase
MIGIVTVINLASRLFGFFREALVGYQFGTSDLADQIILAYTIPNFIYLVVGGALTTAFISIYSKMTDDRLRRAFNEHVFTYVFLAMLLLTSVFILFSDEWIRFFFTGLTMEQTKQTARLFAYMAPSTLFLVLSMWLTGVLNVNGQFYRAALASLLNNVLFVFLAFSLYPFFGVLSYAWGAVVSALAMFVWLAYDARKDVSFRLRFSHETAEYMRRMIKIGVPILLGGATLQFYFLIHRIFASQLEAGYVAALNYASKLVQLPQTILMTSITTVIYPLLAKKVAERADDEIARIFRQGMKQLLLLIVPISMFVYIYAQEIVSIIFEYGAFTEKSTEMTAQMLKIFVIGMFAHAANVFVTRFFYAKERSLLPVLSGFISVFVINVALIAVFIEPFGAAAIAWATTISSYLQLFVLLVASKYMLKLKKVDRSFGFKFLFSSVIVFFVTFLIRQWIPIPFVFVRFVVGGVIWMVMTIVSLMWIGANDVPFLNKWRRTRGGAK